MGRNSRRTRKTGPQVARRNRGQGRAVPLDASTDPDVVVSSSLPSTAINFGKAVRDTATVSGNSGGASPGGSVTFYGCEPGIDTATLGNTRCPQTSPWQNTQTLIKGDGDTSSAVSARFTPPSSGTWCIYRLGKTIPSLFEKVCGEIVLLK